MSVEMPNRRTYLAACVPTVVATRDTVMVLTSIQLRRLPGTAVDGRLVSRGGPGPDPNAEGLASFTSRVAKAAPDTEIGSDLHADVIVSSEMSPTWS